MPSEIINAQYSEFKGDLKARSQFNRKLRLSGVRFKEKTVLPEIPEKPKATNNSKGYMVRRSGSARLVHNNGEGNHTPRSVKLYRGVPDSLRVFVKDRAALKNKKIVFSGLPGRNGTYKGQGEIRLGGEVKGKTMVSIFATNYYADGTAKVFRFDLPQKAVDKIKNVDSNLELHI